MLKNFNSIIDLTHTLNSSVPNWDRDCGFKKHLVKDYQQGCLVHNFEMHAGIGTHMDAPLHFIKDSLDIASIPLEKLLVSAHVVNVANKCQPNYFVSSNDIEDYENDFGLLSENSLVIFHTGWSKYWHEPASYRNSDELGAMHFPGILPEVVEILLQRKVVGIAIDTLSPDGSNYEFPVHHLLLGAGKYIIENIANANLLPPAGAFVIALPLKVQGGAEAPIRVVALVSQN